MIKNRHRQSTGWEEECFKGELWDAFPVRPPSVFTYLNSTFHPVMDKSPFWRHWGYGNHIFYYEHEWESNEWGSAGWDTTWYDNAATQKVTVVDMNPTPPKGAGNASETACAMDLEGTDNHTESSMPAPDLILRSFLTLIIPMIINKQ